MNKILILGSSGFLGSAIVDAAPDNAELWLGYNNSKPRHDHKLKQIKMNLSDFSLVREQLFKIKPQIVIHAARIYPFEDDENRAIVIMNNLVAAIKSINAKLIYISSDAVFDGQKGNYKETDLVNPITDYGKAKLAAETVIQKELDDFIIIRPSYIFGNNKGALDKRTNNLTENLKKGITISAFCDMYRSPTLVNDLTSACWKLALSDFTGIMHIAGIKKSVLEFYQKITADFGFDPRLIKSNTIKNSQLPVASDTSLNTDLAQKIIGFKPAY